MPTKRERARREHPDFYAPGQPSQGDDPLEDERNWGSTRLEGFASTEEQAAWTARYVEVANRRGTIKAEYDQQAAAAADTARVAQSEYERAHTDWLIAKTRYDDKVRAYRLWAFAGLGVALIALLTGVSFLTAAVRLSDNPRRRITELAVVVAVLVLWIVRPSELARRWTRRLRPGPAPRLPTEFPAFEEWAGARLPALPRTKSGPIGLTERRFADLVRWFKGCAYCATQRNNHLAFQVEHVVPLSRGGPDSVANVVPACRECNIEKGQLTGLQYWNRRQARGLAVNPRFLEWIASHDFSSDQ